MEANTKTRTIILTNFPQPELLTIETDFKYYDKREGWANPFTATDLTEINHEAKQHIIDKIPESGLFKEASKQALQTIQMMEKIGGNHQLETRLFSIIRFRGKDKIEQMNIVILNPARFPKPCRYLP